MSEDIGAFREELVQKLVPHYGEVTSKTRGAGEMATVIFTNGVKMYAKSNGPRIEQWPSGEQLIVSWKKILLKKDGRSTDYNPEEQPVEEGKSRPKPVCFELSEFKAKPTASGSPAKPSPKAAAKPSPKKPEAAEKRKREEDEKESSGSDSSSSSSSDSDSSASGSSESERIKKKPRVAAVAKPKPEAKKPAAKKPPAKKASPKKRVVKTPASPPKKEKKPVDINDDTEATLGDLVLELAKGLDLSDAHSAEEKRKQEEAAANQKAPPKPKSTKFPSKYDALVTQIEKLQDKIKKEKARLQGKDDTKEVSLTTSKTNYIDPRVIYAWCKREDVPIKQVYTQPLILKFPWAAGADTEWRF